MRGGFKVLCAAAFLALAAVGLSATSSFALEPYDVPEISCESAGLYSITLHVCGGATTGAPAGVSIQWTTRARYEELGGVFPSSTDPDYCALSLSGQPSMQHPDKSRWGLLPGECEDIQIGDINFDETGVSGGECAMGPLECGTEYVFRIFAHAGRGMARSPFSDVIYCNTDPCDNGGGCTYTQGYWKTHGPEGCRKGQNSNEWPATGLMLGNVAYSDVQLCAIFNEPAGGNGLIALAHQLIAAKLNLLNGAGHCGVDADIAAADALIGNLVVPPVGAGSLAPEATSALVNSIDEFNNGDYQGCAGHCDVAVSPQMRARFVGPFQSTRSSESSWGQVKTRYR